MSLESRLRALERDEGPLHIYVTANGITIDPRTGEAMPGADWRARHLDALTFTSKSDRPGEEAGA